MLDAIGYKSGGVLKETASCPSRTNCCRDTPAKAIKLHAERIRRAIDREDTQMHAFTVLINEESARAKQAEQDMQQELEQVPACITSRIHPVAIDTCLDTFARR